MLISIYDLSAIWAKPYADAGWKVLLWDKQVEGCILEKFSHLCWLIEKNLEGQRLAGLIVQPPCTAFAGSGALHWEGKDTGWPEKHRDGNMDQIFDTFTEYMQALTWIAWELKQRYNPHFWVFENPVGRIEELCPELKPYKKLIFQPWEFGDPYTKRTVLYGEFNADLPRSPVEPTEGSKMHTLPPSEDRAAIRSQSPKGFAQAFFEANHEYVVKQTKLAI